MKRRDDNRQLSREELSAMDDDEPEEAGQFKKADSSVIAQRKIIKAKRPSSEHSSTAGSNPFASFTGFTGAAAPKAPAVSNPFANFTGFTAPPAKASATLGERPSASTVDISPAPTISSTIVGEVSNKKKSDLSETSSSAAPNSKMEQLNKAFLSWTGKQAQEHPLSIWTDGLKDYLKYASKISDLKDTKQPISSTVNSSNVSDQKDTKQPISSSVNFSNEVSAKLADKEPVKEKKTDVVTGFSFSSAPLAEKKTETVAPLPVSAEFSFVKPSNSAKDVPQAPASFTGFSFTGGDKKDPAPFLSGGSAFPAFGEKKTDSGFLSTSFSFPSSGFSATGNIFGIAPPSSLPAASIPPVSSAAADDNAEDDDGAEGDEVPYLEPEKVERNKDDTDEILHECAKCKLFRYKNETKEWAEFGKGVFRVTRDLETKKKRILIRNMTGKVVLNVSFYSGMNFSKVGKNGIRFMAFVDDSGTPQMMMVKVKEEEFEKTIALLKASAV